MKEGLGLRYLETINPSKRMSLWAGFEVESGHGFLRSKKSEDPQFLNWGLEEPHPWASHAGASEKSEKIASAGLGENGERSGARILFEKKP